MHVGILRPRLSSDLAGAAPARFRDTDERSSKGVDLFENFPLACSVVFPQGGSDGR